MKKFSKDLETLFYVIKKPLEDDTDSSLYQKEAA